jgi:hypothetical protein
MYFGQQLLLSEGPTEAPDHVPGVAFVPGAARAAGGVGDALIEVDEQEHRRRAAVGLGAVTALGLLDRLLALPLGAWVRWADLHPEAVRRLREAPAGVVEQSSEGVRRVLVPAAAVPMVLVRSASWRRGLRTASAFEPFAQRVLVLDNPRQDLVRVAWEADFVGIGVWLQTDSGIEEVVPPAPWWQRYVKAAGWRFRERAYHDWLSATHPVG